MKTYKDMRGVQIQEDDYIVYGKSDRHNPVNLGRVVSLSNDGLEVLGDGNKKTGTIPHFNVSDRVLVLPCDYKDY